MDFESSIFNITSINYFYLCTIGKIKLPVNNEMLKVCKMKLKLSVIFQFKHSIETYARVGAVN